MVATSWVIGFIGLYLLKKIHVLVPMCTATVAIGPKKGSSLGTEKQWVFKSLPTVEKSNLALFPGNIPE